MEWNENRKVERFSLDLLPRSSSLRICCAKYFINNGITNGLKWKKEIKTYKRASYSETRKATGFKSFWVNCWPKVFLNKTCKKTSSKTWTSPSNFTYSKIVQVPNFSLKWKFGILGRNWLIEKEYFCSKKGKMENHYQSLHIQISLGSKFQLQQTVLILLTKFVPPKILPIKNRKN